MKIAAEMQELSPTYKMGYYLEAAVWNERDKLVNEYHALEKMVPLLDTDTPDGKKFAAQTFFNLTSVCIRLCMQEKACEYAYLAFTLTDDKKYALEAISPAIFCINYLENFSDVDYRILYGELRKLLSDIVPFERKFYNHKKIRVGFLSADFKYHAVAMWGWYLFTGLSRKTFQIYCYSAVKKPDDLTKQIRDKVSVWHDIVDLTDEEAAKLIRDDEIDILFDLSGYSKGSKIEIAMYRPASVQVSGIGYINSTGMDCFDFFLSDVYCTEDTAATSDYFTEKVIRMPHSHICFSPLNKVEHAKEPSCRKNGYVTFGSFNNWSKVTDSILRAWKKILDAVPQSHLLLKSLAFDRDDLKELILERIKSFGIDLERVEVRGWTKTHPLDYNDMDIALDTYPYTGCVTTTEALYMGVPVVSLYGDRHGTRMSYSTLKNVGLDELSVNNFDDYVKRAVALANDWELLTILRQNLRGMMEKSPLMDSKNYVRAIEIVFATILDAERKNYESRKDA